MGSEMCIRDSRCTRATDSHSLPDPPRRTLRRGARCPAPVGTALHHHRLSGAVPHAGLSPNRDLYGAAHDLHAAHPPRRHSPNRWPSGRGGRAVLHIQAAPVSATRSRRNRNRAARGARRRHRVQALGPGQARHRGEAHPSPRHRVRSAPQCAVPCVACSPLTRHGSALPPSSTRLHRRPNRLCTLRRACAIAACTKAPRSAPRGFWPMRIDPMIHCSPHAYPIGPRLAPCVREPQSHSVPRSAPLQLALKVPRSAPRGFWPMRNDPMIQTSAQRRPQDLPNLLGVQASQSRSLRDLKEPGQPDRPQLRSPTPRRAPRSREGGPRSR